MNENEQDPTQPGNPEPTFPTSNRKDQVVEFQSPAPAGGSNSESPVTTPPGPPPLAPVVPPSPPSPTMSATPPPPPPFDAPRLMTPEDFARQGSHAATKKWAIGFGVLIILVGLYFIGTNEGYFANQFDQTGIDDAILIDDSQHDLSGGDRVDPSPSASASNQQINPDSSSSVKTIDTAEAKFTTKSFGAYCKAAVPAGWTGSTSGGSAIDLTSSDSNMYAGWGIVSINPSMQQFYGDLYGDPATSMRFLANEIAKKYFGDSGVDYTSGEKDFDQYFSQREFAGSRTKGMVYYRIYDGSGGSYVESMYFAVTTADLWEQEKKTVANIAASITCQTPLRPSSSGGSLGSGSSGSSGGSTDDGADGLSSSSYNKELGTQYVTDKETGENYLVDPSTDYVDGPDGYGAYKDTGSGLVRLEEGRSDDY